MSTIGWVIDHYEKITLFCASLIDLCIMKLSLNVLVLNNGLNSAVYVSYNYIYRCREKVFQFVVIVLNNRLKESIG